MIDDREVGLEGGSDDQERLALERAILGTSQHLMAVIDSERWGTAQDLARSLEDVRNRMEVTSQMIDRWLESHRP
jgi:hypothetical protein